MKRFKQLLFRRKPERLDKILGSASHIVQPPLSIRPSALRKSKSQDTDNRRPVEGALAAEGVHRTIDSHDRRFSESSNVKWLTIAIGFREEAFAATQPAKRSTITRTNAPSSLSPTDATIIHDKMSQRPTATHSISTPNMLGSGPSTPIGKGHAHDPLEDTLFLNIGTGEQSASADTFFVSESPSNVDINVYETAYEEEVQRIINQRKDQHRSPTLYLTRRVEDIKRIRDSDCVFDEGKDIGRGLKGGFKEFVKKTKEDIEARGELQKLQEGREGKLGRTMRNVREAKRLVEEARERVKIEDRERERERSRSSTPVPRNNSSGSVQMRTSRSGTPVGSGI